MYYKSSLRSYRDLPMKIGELGTVYRYERGGTLHGMLRVRGFTQDDAHIFCTPDQIETEIDDVLDLTFDLMEAFGFDDFTMSLSTKPDKAVGSDEQWQLAEKSLMKTLDSKGLEYQIEEAGGAFYGPKIDVNIRDAIGRSWQCTTVQFDFNLPERFGLTYIGEDGGSHQPFMVHRAIFGSLERFMGILIEHYGGAFPTWLAPTQVQIIPIADRHIEYATSLHNELSESGIRSGIDARSERMNAKVRDAQIAKVPYMFIVGDREVEAETVGVRLRSGEDLGPLSLKEMKKRISSEVDDKIT
jgi:threonyl-tRNA synthetase